MWTERVRCSEGRLESNSRFFFDTSMTASTPSAWRFRINATAAVCNRSIRIPNSCCRRYGKCRATTSNFMSLGTRSFRRPMAMVDAVDEDTKALAAGNNLLTQSRSSCKAFFCECSCWTFATRPLFARANRACAQCKALRFVNLSAGRIATTPAYSSSKATSPKSI